MKHHIILLSLLLFGFGLFAQDRFSPAYILTLENDTIRGTIKNTNPRQMAKECIFDINGEKTKYLPGEIKGFGIGNDQVFVSKTVTQDSVEKMVFLEYLVQGEADLLFYRSDIRLHFFIISEKGEILELINSETEETIGTRDYIRYGLEYVKTLKEVFADAPSIIPEVDKVDLTQRELIDITVKYHDLTCEDGQECTIYDKTTKTKRRIGISLGTIGNQLAFLPKRAPYGYLLGDSASGRGYFIAFRYSSTNLFGLSESWSFHTGVRYRWISYEGSFLSFSRGSIMIPLLVQYKTRGRFVRPFAQLGLLNYLHVNSQAEVPIAVREEPFNEALTSYFHQVELQLGAGIEIGTVSLSAHYNLVSPFTGLGNIHNDYLSSRIRGFTFQLDVFFSR